MATKKSEEMDQSVEVVEKMETSTTTASTFTSFASWSKLYAILGFIGAGFTILVGIPYILALGFGLLMIAAGVFYILAYNKVLQASNLVAGLEKSKGNSKEFAATTEEVISNLKSYFKIISIINLVSIAGGIIITILFVVFFAAIGASFSNVTPELNKPTPTINYK